MSSPLSVLRLPKPSRLCVDDCSSYDRPCYHLCQIPSLHLQTHTGRTGTSHTGTPADWSSYWDVVMKLSKNCIWAILSFIFVYFYLNVASTCLLACAVGRRTNQQHEDGQGFWKRAVGSRRIHAEDRPCPQPRQKGGRASSWLLWSGKWACAFCQWCKRYPQLANKNIAHGLLLFAIALNRSVQRFCMNGMSRHKMQDREHHVRHVC